MIFFPVFLDKKKLMDLLFSAIIYTNLVVTEVRWIAFEDLTVSLIEYWQQGFSRNLTVILLNWFSEYLNSSLTVAI